MIPLRNLRRQLRRRASVLLTTVIFIALISIVMMSVMSHFRQVTRLTAATGASDQAFYAAEAGIARAMSYIYSKGSGQPTGIYDNAFNVTQANKMNPFSQDWVSLAEGINAASGTGPAVRTRIWHDTANGNWKIEATGRIQRPKNLYRKVTAVLQAGSFARYAFFNDTSVSAMDGKPRWLSSGETFNGPVHSNKDMYVQGSSSSHLVFNSDVTIVGNEYVSGSSSYIDYNGLKDTNADYVDLPDDLTDLKAAAASGGVNLPASDTSKPTGFTDADGILNYKFAFNANGTVTVTNLDAQAWAAAQTPVKTYTPMTVTISNTNGAIVVNNGNAFVSGTLSGRVTVAATVTNHTGSSPPNPLGTTKTAGNMIVDGNFVYNTHPKVSGSYDISDSRTFDPATVTDVAGLIAERNFALDGGVPTNCIVDAHVMVTGQATTNPDVRTWEASTDTSHVWSQAINQDGAFYVEDGVQTDLSYNWTGFGTNTASQLSDTSGNSGNLYLTGGVVHFLRGQTANGTGYVRRYAFDQRLMKTPPPYYPLTPDLEIVGWKDDPSTTQPS